MSQTSAQLAEWQYTDSVTGMTDWARIAELQIQLAAALKAKEGNELAYITLKQRMVELGLEETEPGMWRNKAKEEAERKLNTPELHDFAQAVVLEAAHQRERWGSEHDAGKAAEDWLWLIAYLSTKAAQASRYGDADKYLHHIITCAAACANWHAHVSGASTAMRPGVDPNKYAAIDAALSGDKP